MSEELEALERIRKKLAKHYGIKDIYEWTSIEDDLDIIETKLKNYLALEIIRTKKGLNLDYLKTCENVEQYNKTHLIEKTLVERYAPLYHLTQEEFDLLKETLR